MRFKNNLLFLVCFVTNFIFISSVGASPSLGTPAPQFKGIDSNGNEVSLSDFQKNKLIALNQMYRTKSDRETKMPYHLNTIGLIKSVNYYSLQNKNITWTKFSHIAQERSN